MSCAIYMYTIRAPRRAGAGAKPHPRRRVTDMSGVCHHDPLSVAGNSICPEARWHTRIAPILAASAQELVMLNIGANKGFNLLEFAQRYTTVDANLTHTQWYRLLMANGCQSQCCGVCKSCKLRRIPQQANVRLSMHAFELQPSNANMLRRMMVASNLPVAVHSTAVSNITGTVYTAGTIKAGAEAHGLVHRARKNDVPQPVTTVDAFMTGHHIDRAHFVSIDTEGTRAAHCSSSHMPPSHHNATASETIVAR